MSIPSGKPAHDTNPLDRLDEIQARADKTTDGPWDAAKVYPDGPCDIVQIGHDEYGQEWASEQIAERVESLADAEFIVHAHTDVPALVSALRAVLKFADLCDAEDQVFQAWVVRDALRVQISDALGEARP